MHLLKLIHMHFSFQFLIENGNCLCPPFHFLSQLTCKVMLTNVYLKHNKGEIINKSILFTLRVAALAIEYLC